MIHLENNMNIMFAPGTLRTYYRGTDQTAIIGITNKLVTLARNILANLFIEFYVYLKLVLSRNGRLGLANRFCVKRKERKGKKWHSTMIIAIERERRQSYQRRQDGGVRRKDF